MEELVTHTAEWTVLVRTNGDALAVRAGRPGLELGFLGAPPGLTSSEIETWLSELIGVAGTTGSDSPVLTDPATSIPIPRILHQALSGLLFYEAELWGGTAGQSPCAIACWQAGARVAFGWTGSGRVEVLLNGRSFDPDWILVRDDEGRHARAFVADASAQLEARLCWPGTSGGTVPDEGGIDARWPGLPIEAPEVAEVPAGSAAESEPDPAVGGTEGAETGSEAESTSPAGSDPDVRPVRRRGAWHFRGWMDRLAGLRAREDSRAESSPSEPIAHDVPGVPDLLPVPAPDAAGAPASIDETPEPAEPEAPGGVEESPAPAAEEARAAEQEAPVDPFDPGPLTSFEPERVAEAAPGQPEPAALEPALAGEPPPEPAAGEVAVISESCAEARPQDGAAGATETESPRARRRPAVRHPAWPEPESSVVPDRHPLWQKRWPIVAIVVGLFATGWFLGQVDFSRGARDIKSALMAIGLGRARYDLIVTSRPSGAWIAVDGVDLARRTPATLELKPGSHDVVLSFSGVGGSSHAVKGRRGQRVALDVELWGALKVAVPGSSVPISIAVDGVQRGYAPLDVEQLQPGIHRLQFSGPGVTPWEQTVEVHVNRTAEIVARPIASPATGVLEVRAALADETGTESLTGAQVWIDGQLSGVTPLRLELPRGPHSIRVRHRGEEGPVQVIELPGGNLRYATVQLGMSQDAPRLAATLPERIPLDRPTVLSASLDGASEGDVHEMWLHVRTPEGAWRRYPMTMMKAPGGLVGVAVFPSVLFDARGRAAWYVSASTPMGDEYFTEMRPAQAASKP